MTTTAPSPTDFLIYNAGVTRAVRAHAADQAVRAGLCAVCHWRRKDGRHGRRCRVCAAFGYREGATW